jgi:hypothetical protein
MDKMAEVVSLHGNYQPQSHEPNATVVEELERLLDAARAGEIIGLAGSYMHKDKIVTYSYAGLVAGYSIVGSLSCLRERLMQIIMSRD